MTEIMNEGYLYLFVCDLAITFRDAPITIFLADSYFRFVCESDLQI